MSFRHVASHHLRRLARQHPVLRRFSLTLTAVVLLWLYVLHWGERSNYNSHISACNWDAWEKWPSHAVPHHLVFVADPQLVDPHTYPGRPWPLSTLTELYTDQYMSRNFRLINAQLDPDTIIFLGDLFDGGREWATERAQDLPAKPKREEKQAFLHMIKGGKEATVDLEQDEPEGGLQKRKVEKFKTDLTKPHGRLASSPESKNEQLALDRKSFVYGENARWSNWGHRQWLTDFERFGSIFFDTNQLYPGNQRRTVPGGSIPTTTLNVENGANAVEWQEYATTGGKQRRILTSLPGNHDLGFGSGVQLPVRERFNSHFGESNKIDVVGNHTFISLDVLSLSAAGQFIPPSRETTPDQVKANEYLWKDSMDFLENLRTPAGKVVAQALGAGEGRGMPHHVTHPKDLGRQPSLSELAGDALKVKPQLPTVLLTHIPLYRDPDTDCGPLREKGKAISVAAGYQYQNVLTRAISDMIIKKVSAAGEVVQAFSGDDHDYCDVTHRYNVGMWNGGADTGIYKGAKMMAVKEVTVKSFSWAMGVRKPGFLLVSLWNPVDEMGRSLEMGQRTLQTHLCLLPDQLSVFVDYAILLCTTLIILLVRAIVLSLQHQDPPDSDEAPDSPRLPNYSEKSPNGNSSISSDKKSRHRASSTSTSTANTSNNLHIQRSQAARTRSVSPAVPLYGVPVSSTNGFVAAAPLIERAGYYPELKWDDPDDSDEESHMGVEDSQAKWNRRPRRVGRARRAVGTFAASLGWVAVLGGGWYVFLVRTG